MKAQRSSLPSPRMGRPAWHAGLVLVPLVVGALCGGVTELNAQAGTPVPQIVFVSPYRGARQIFRLSAEGDGRQRLPSPPGDSEGPAWSGEGQRLLFVRSDGDNVQIYPAGAGGMGLQRLTAPPGTHAEAAWSPDGHRIAYITRVAGVGHISLMNADGRDQRILSGPPASASAPAWSPDGRLIAFLARSKGSGAELYVTRSDAGGIRRIPTPATGVVPGVSEFAWLRDGQHIAYTTRAGPAQSDISLVGLDGAPPRWLAFGYAPSWSLRVTYSSAPEPFDRARKAIRRPSGDHAGADAEAGGPLRIRWSRPSAFMREMCPTPATRVMYAMRWPSGDHAASACVPGGAVSRCNPIPPALAV